MHLTASESPRAQKALAGLVDRYGQTDLDDAEVLACLRAMGLGIEDMRTYQANRARGRAAAAEQRDIMLRHAVRVEEQIATLRVHLDYLRAKATLWQARDHGDPVAEEAARFALDDILPRLQETFR